LEQSQQFQNNKEKIKHKIEGGWIDINNKQNKKIFNSILDEYKVLKDKVNKYQEMPGKYNEIKSKYMNIKDGKNENSENGSDEETKENPIKILMNGKEINEKEKEGIKLKINDMKRELKQQKRIEEMVRNKGNPHFGKRAHSLRKTTLRKASFKNETDEV